NSMTGDQTQAIFVKDDSGNNYLLPGKMADRFKIGANDRAEMEKRLNADVSGYEAGHWVNLVTEYFGWMCDADGNWSPPEAAQADHWTRDGVVNMQDYYQALQHDNP